MPIGSEFLGDGWRDASIPGLPPLQVRRPVMRETTSAAGTSRTTTWFGWHCLPAALNTCGARMFQRDQMVI